MGEELKNLIDEMKREIHRLHNSDAAKEQRLADQNNMIIALQAQERDHRDRVADLTGEVRNRAHAAPAGGANGRKILPRITFNNGEKEDWLSFKESFENFADFQRYSDPDAKLALKSCMQGAALLSVTDINHKVNTETLADLLKRYEAKFLPPAASALAMAHFEDARQGTKETILAFHGRLATLYARAYPGEPIGMPLIRKFMVGLRTLRMREFVQRARPTTWAEVLQAAQSEQAVVESNRSVAYEDAMDISVMDLKKVKCHHCQKMGHVVANCHQKKKEIESASAKKKIPPPRPNPKKKSWGPPGRKPRPQKFLNEVTADSSDGEEDPHDSSQEPDEEGGPDAPPSQEVEASDDENSDDPPLDF
jgi:hypothetical protein